MSSDDLLEFGAPCVLAFAAILVMFAVQLRRDLKNKNAFTGIHSLYCFVYVVGSIALAWSSLKTPDYAWSYMGIFMLMTLIAFTTLLQSMTQKSSTNR